MYGLGVNKLGVNNTTDPIAKLFASGSEGAWYDPSDLSTLFQEDGTTPAVVDGVVGKVLDKSGNGNHLVQTVQTKCPILRQSGGLYYLDFDGTDDGLKTSASVDMSGTDALSIFSGAQKAATGTNQNVAEFSDNVGTNNGAFRLFCQTNEEWRSILKGTVANVLDTEAVGNPNTSTFTITGDISDGSHTFRRNGSLVAANTNGQGTGNYGNHPLNLGARNDGTASNLDGNIYSFIFVDRICTDSEIAAVEEYVARKTGVSI